MQHKKKRIEWTGEGQRQWIWDRKRDREMNEKQNNSIKSFD